MTTNTPQDNQHDTSNEKILRWPDVHEKTNIARNTAHTLARSGKFPKPIKLGQRSSGWLLSEINAWLAERIEARNTGSAK